MVIDLGLKRSDTQASTHKLSYGFGGFYGVESLFRASVFSPENTVLCRVKYGHFFGSRLSKQAQNQRIDGI
jgi:hypothetical protein